MLKSTDDLDLLALAHLGKRFLPLPKGGGQWRIVVRRSVASVGILGCPEARLLLDGDHGEWGFIDFHLRSARVTALNGPGIPEAQKYAKRPAALGDAIDILCRANGLDCEVLHDA